MGDPDLSHVMMGLHDELGQAFFEHQVALLDRDFARAARTLAEYRRVLFAHMQDEETHVLPRYVALGGDATDAPLRLFLGEHKNLRTFLDDFGVRIATLAKAADDRALLDLFDRQATYKNLMLHHDLRERNALYPFLAARLSADEQQAILRAASSRSGGRC